MVRKGSPKSRVANLDINDKSKILGKQPAEFSIIKSVYIKQKVEWLKKPLNKRS